MYIYRLEMARFGAVLMLLLYCVSWNVSTSTKHHDGDHAQKSLSILLTTLPYPGHVTPAAALGEELVRRGHNVTLCTTLLEGNNIAQRKAKEAGMNFMSAGPDYMTYGEYQNMSKFITGTWTEYLEIMKKAIYMIPETPNRIGKHLEQSGMKSVDMIISTEFMTQMTACLSRRWGVPAVILSTTFQVHPHHLPPWPFPVHVTKKRGGRVSTSDNLSFLQRLGFAIIKPLAALSWAYVVTQFQLSYFEFECPVTRSYAELFPGIYAPQIVPTVIGFEYPRTSSPLTHYVGAVVSKNPQNLSAELETWLDSKPERSVVFVSMGSVAQLSAEHGKAIVNAIQVTGHSAIWSLRENNRYILEGLELDKERFSILSWVPQLAALQHKAISLAILQGGMNGVHEAIYFGVPVITVPFVNDQADVSARVDHHEVGIQLLRSQLTTDNLVASINAIEAGRIWSQIGGGNLTCAKQPLYVLFCICFKKESLVLVYGVYVCQGGNCWWSCFYAPVMSKKKQLVSFYV